MRYLATGDLHLGAGGDLGNAPGERLAEQAAVWARIVGLAAELEVDAILFAGDAFEGPIPTPEHYAAFAAPLATCGIPIIAITGNGRHDAAMRSSTALHVAQAPCLFVYDKPGLHRVGGKDTVAVLPWAPVSRIVAASAGGDRDEINRLVADGIVEIARGLYADACKLPGARILMTHFSVGGATTPSGAPTDLFREPVLDAGALEAIGFDAVVVGHIHLPQMLWDRGFYVGSPMPLNFGEAATDHVVWLLDVEAGDFQAFQIPIESRPLKSYTVYAREVGPSVGIDVPLDYDGAIVKIKIHATQEEARRLDVGAIKAQFLDPKHEIASGPAPRAHKVWSVKVDVDRADSVHERGDGLDEGMDDVEAMMRWLETNSSVVGGDGDLASDVLDLYRGYVAKAAA